MGQEKRTKLNTKETFVFYKTPQNIVEWFNSYGIAGDNLNVFDARKMRNKVVCGMSVPLHVASFAWKTIELNVKNVLDKPMEELTVEEIDELWHQVRIYDAKSKRIYFEDKNWEKEIKSFTVMAKMANKAAKTLLKEGIISPEQFEDVENKILNGYKNN